MSQPTTNQMVAGGHRARRVLPRRAVLVAAAALLGACRDDALAPVTLSAPLPADAVQAVVQEVPGPEVGTVALVVRVVGRAKELAAYQGTFTYDPAAFEVLSAETPTTVADGEVHLVNRDDVPTGRIRFAAYAPEAFAGDEAFRLVGRRRVPTGEAFDAAPSGAAPVAPMSVILEVGGTASGTPLTRAQLRPSAGVHDAEGRLVK